MKLTPMLAACAFVFSTLTVVAGPKITGGTHYQFGAGNAAVTFGCEGISNPSKENATGTLKMELWALQAPHTGGGISGILLADYKLDGLNPGGSYGTVRKTVKAAAPARRQSYVLCLTLMEYQGGAYVISDYRNYANPVVLGPQALFSLAGPWHWQSSLEGGTVDIAVAKISHTRTASTGTLKLALWATSSPYTGGAIQGYKLGEVSKAALKPGYTYADVKNTAKYTAPPHGTYYVSLLLSEFDGAEYRIEAHLGSANPTAF